MERLADHNKQQQDLYLSPSDRLTLRLLERGRLKLLQRVSSGSRIGLWRGCRRVYGEPCSAVSLCLSLCMPSLASSHV